MTDTAEPTPPSSSARERRTAGETPAAPTAPEPSSSSTTAAAEETPKRRPGTYDVKDGPTARARRAEQRAAEAAETPAE